MGISAERSTAIHEAGHAVAALACGLTVTAMTIVPNEDNWGSTIHGPLACYDDTKRERTAAVRVQAVICYAGYEAEKLYNPAADPDCSQCDNVTAFDGLRECPPRNCRCIGDEVYWAALERLRHKARRLVRLHWTRIERVADVLLEQQTLTGPEVAALVGPIGPP